MTSETTQQDLINAIVNDGRYKSICRKLAARRTHLAEDLYQEAMLAIIEKTDNSLIKAFKEGYLEVYVVGVINKIWNKRGQVKHNANGSTSNLHEYTSTFYAGEESEFFDRQHLSEVTKSYDPKIDQVFEATKTIIKKDCLSNNNGLWYHARIYNYSNNNIAGLSGHECYSSPYEFSKTVKIPRKEIYKAYKVYKDHLKEQVKNLFND